MPLLAALTLISGLSIDASEQAVLTSHQIASEFIEDAKVDLAVREAHDNVGIVFQRLSAHNGRASASLDREMRLSALSLEATVSAALDQDANVRRKPEAASARITYASYREYRGVRERIRGVVGARETAVTSRERRELSRAFNTFRDDLVDFANVHRREARAMLDGQRANEARFKRALLLAFGFAAASLLAVGVVARRLTIRLRDKSGFAARVATGDLSARIQPHGRDELAALGRSLNAMVEQLAAAARERREIEEADRAYHAARHALSEALQVSDTEHEAHDVLKRHIERELPASSVVVLNRNNSENRLIATTPVEAGSPVAEALKDAEPRSCLGVRLARVHSSAGGDSSLLECRICGAAPEASTCAPLLVSGEVIGSVLVNNREPLGARDLRTVRDAVGQAAPTLANLRNLALAEARAATDALTGLPNRRSMDNTLKRMLAQADRLSSPLAVLMLDLDHFKSINDTHGHDQGDAVLAAVADVLSSTVRTGDFAARTGGEEFVVLLPATGPEGAAVAAEAIRSAIAAPVHAGLRHAVTASVGVAVYPDDATDAETLLRLADRALYAAKAGGRNRVALAGAPPSSNADSDGGVGSGLLTPATGHHRPAASIG